MPAAKAHPKVVRLPVAPAPPTENDPWLVIVCFLFRSLSFMSTTRLKRHLLTLPQFFEVVGTTCFAVLRGMFLLRPELLVTIVAFILNIVPMYLTYAVSRMTDRTTLEFELFINRLLNSFAVAILGSPTAVPMPQAPQANASAPVLEHPQYSMQPARADPTVYIALAALFLFKFGGGCG
jgi:hypothetical protein